MADADDRFDVQPNVGNHFAWMRTLLALQRTLMASVRTAVSLIGFGFTVAQFFKHLRGNLPEELRLAGPDMPRNLGLLLIAAGVVSVALFTIRYHATVAYLRSVPFAAIAAAEPRSLHRPTYLVAWTVMLIGVIAFGSVFLQFCATLRPSRWRLHSAGMRFGMSASGSGMRARRDSRRAGTNTRFQSSFMLTTVRP